MSILFISGLSQKMMNIISLIIIIIFNHHPRICLLILERGREREGEKEKHRSVASVCALTRNQISHLLVYRTKHQPTEPPYQGVLSHNYYNLSFCLPPQGKRIPQKVSRQLSKSKINFDLWVFHWVIPIISLHSGMLCCWETYKDKEWTALFVAH